MSLVRPAAGGESRRRDSFYLEVMLWEKIITQKNAIFEQKTAR